MSFFLRFRYASYLVILAFITSCGILGIHTKVGNPNPGTLRPVSPEMQALGKENDLRICYDVTFYHLDVFINAKEKSIGGWVEIRAKALKNIDSLQFDLHPNMQLEELHLQTKEGDTLTFKRNLRAVVVTLKQTLQAGKTFSLFVKYHGKPMIASRPPWAGGTVWKKDKHHKDWLGVACETEGSSIWFPCKDLTNDEPDSALIELSIPDNGLTAVSNGVLVNTSVKEGVKTFSWRVHYPINLYNITYYVGDFTEVKDQYTGVEGKVLNLTHYVLRDHAEIAAEHFQKVKENIHVYEETWGPFAFYEDGFKLIESPYAGMEHQTAIAYGNKFKTDLYGVEDYIMLHETGHEWFGNAVSAGDLADVWLQEGITTYGESVYLEKQYSKQLALRHMLFYRLTIKNKLPVVAPYGLRYFDYHDGDVYVKGAWILHTLRYQLNNDSLFFKILRTFYAENALKSTDSKTFIATVNRLTGKDYNWYFNQYLYKSSVPVLEYQVKDRMLYYRWTECDTSFNKLQVSVQLEGLKEWYPLKPEHTVKSISLPAGVGKEVRPDNLHALFGFRENKKLYKE